VLRKPIVLAGTAATVLLSACSGLSGLGGSDEYGCKAPPGVKCQSVSGTYYNALQNNLPSQRPRHPSGAAQLPASSPAPPTSRNGALATMTSAAEAPFAAGGEARAATRSRPLRTQAKVLRLWIKAYEDTDRDLHDQGFVFVQIDSGRWLIDHAQREAREAYAPIRPPRILGDATRSDATRSGSDRTSSVVRPMPASSASGTWPPAVRGLQGAATERAQGGSK
jgi:conjugal transfer pilus assembly protein TraV